MDGLLGAEGAGEVFLHLLLLGLADVVVGGILQVGLDLPGLTGSRKH